MVIHAVAEIAGRCVLPKDDALNGLANLFAVQTEIRIFAGCEEGHERHASDARSLFTARPVTAIALSFGEILQPAVVHFTNVARDDLADMFLRQLSVAGSSGAGDDGNHHCRYSD